MTREEALKELAEWREQMKNHGVPDYGKKLMALGVAIEALQQVTGKLNNRDDCLLTGDAADVKEHKSKLDLISRADAIDTVEELNRKVNDGTGYGTICTPDVLRRINALPSADAVEVVRCKNCKHRYEAECPMYWEEQIDIDEGDGYYDTDYIFHDYTQDNGYCNWGERREP